MIVSNLSLKEGSSKWEELWVEFTPVQSGNVLVELRSPMYPDIKTNHHEVWVDDFSVTGGDAKIVNGGFETVDEKGIVTGYSQSPSKDILNSTKPKSGKNCAQVWINQPLTQNIAVKAGTKYKVSAWFLRDL